MTTQTSTTGMARPSRGRIVALVLLAAVVLAAVVVAGAVWWLDRSVERVGVEGLGEGGLGGEAEPGNRGSASETDGPEAEGADDAEDPDSITVLVLGSDSRDVLTEEERAELGTGYAEGERTEVIALTRLDPAAEEVRVLSVPRDSLVERCDGSNGRVNAAYGIGEREEEGGGISCVVETLRSWLDVRIDHVVMVNFRGFVDIVDALGGVGMYLDEPIRDERAHLDLDAGCNRLDGADALAFVRARSIDNDFGRMERQHRFMTELRDELAAQGVLTDLPRLLRVAEATTRAVEVDDTLTLGRVHQLVRQHRDTVRGDIDGRSIPGEIRTIDGIAFVVPDQQRARELTRWLVTGRDIADLLVELEEEDDEGQDDPGPDDSDLADEAGTDDQPADVEGGETAPDEARIRC